MALRSRNKVSPNFNMSSMTDIVFLLLIFFMLTSTLVSPNALKLLLPSSEEKTVDTPRTISISIKEDAKTKGITFHINDNETPVLIENIEAKVIELLKSEADPGIILHTDKSVAIEHVVKIMNIAYSNEYKIVLATKPN